MAHYAFLDENNIVTEVIVGVDENDTSALPESFADWEAWYTDFKGQTCKRTSYNTIDNTHTEGGTPFRGNYAGIGYSYDPDNDVFLEPKPYASWIINSDTWTWKAPLDLPADSDEVSYTWDEDAYQEDNTTGWITN